MYKHTLITLIPKSKHASSIEDFRPISLRNTFYKIIAKILTNKLKNVLPHIIHKSQSAFIMEMDIVDNIALAQKLWQTQF